MTKISICICTRRRTEGLQKLLMSLEKAIIPADTEVRIVIVENDETNYSEKVVRDYALKSKLDIRYFLETEKGLVYARNRSVAESGDCDFCCFTDDDEVVGSDWLIEMMRCQREFDADGVAGPTRPLFSTSVAPWIEKFHRPDSYPYGTIVGSAFTGCLLLRKSILDRIDGPFDRRLNFSGGEDSYLTSKITSLGGVIRFNPDALAYEVIPDERTKIKFMIRRTYRRTNTRLFLNSFDSRNEAGFRIAWKLILRLFYGLLLLIPCFILGNEDKYIGLIKISSAAGGFAYFLGKKSQFYK